MKTFTKTELRKILNKHQEWLENKPSGQRADLSETNLSRADLSGVNLYGVNLYGANLSRANLSRADLSGANLSETNLFRANLSEANYNLIYEDFMSKLILQKEEVLGLFMSVLDGKIDGSHYEGACACFVGTIAKVKHCDYRKLKIKPDPDSPTERLFLAIEKGDTPENNPISEIVADWIIEFMLENNIDVPQREIIWS